MANANRTNHHEEDSPKKEDAEPVKLVRLDFEIVCDPNAVY
ncbi:hypothetical protein ACQPW1_00975 [Nocardia sp. CA-128927]